MNRYDSYKDSGVEWIGEIPSGWSTNRLKWVSQIENSGVWGEDDEFPNSINVPIPTTGQLSIDGEWYYDKMNLRNLSNDEWNKYKCIEGDIVVVKSSGSSTNIITGKCGFISEEDSEKFGFSNFLMRVRPNKMIPKLVYYFLSSNLTKQRIERMVSSTTYPNLKVDEYSNSELLIPPLSEQQQIVSFLDTKTSLIDSLIEKTQRKIELLKEKRTSLINEVVTKGLNPKVEMKDSGVGWIGEIPSGWEFTRIKYFVNFDSGYSFKSEDYSENGIPLIRIGSLYNNTLSFERSPIFLPEEFERDYNQFVIEKNDILISMTGTLGKRDYGYSILYNEEFPSLLNQRVGRIRLSSERVNLNYLMYNLLSEPFLLQLFSKPTGTKQGNLSSDDIIGNYFGLPPLNEQQQIVEYLDEQTQMIDKTISIEEKRIELLKEYRQSLISEVVTGKRKVVE